MPGNELSQVMSGVDYGGTMVTGLLFSQGQGWDKADWYDYPWDHFGTSNVITFRGDGTTSTYTLPSAPTDKQIYQVYITENDSTRRKLPDVIRGDGSTKTFSLSEIPNDGVLIEFIPVSYTHLTLPTKA